MGETSEACEEISTQEQLVRRAIETSMPRGVPGQMNGTQPAPNIDLLPILDPSIRHEGLEDRQRPPYPLQQTCHPRPSTIPRPAGVVIRIAFGCRDPRAAF